MFKEKGFTLIELLIVIAIIGILAAAILPRFTSFNISARDATTRANLSALRGALIQYRANEGNWPVAVNGLTPTYIERIPFEFLSAAAGTNLTTNGNTNDDVSMGNALVRTNAGGGWIYGNYDPGTGALWGRSMLPVSTRSANGAGSTNSW